MKRFLIILFLAHFALNIMAQKIISDDKYIKQAFQELIDDAKKGDVEAQYVLGMHCFLGKSILKDEEKGLLYLNKAADTGYVAALQELGKYWFKRNKYDLAESYLTRAIHNYNKNSQYADIEEISNLIYDIAVYYAIKDNDPIKVKIASNMNNDALRCFQLIEDYDDDALEILMIYYSSIDDYKNAYQYCIKAYNKQIPSSGFWLGLIYEYGLGQDKNLEKAIKAYELGANSSDDAASQPCRKCLTNICYSTNKMDKAFKYAYDYAHNVVDNDSSTADILHILATCYRFGRGTTQNIALADIWDLLAMWYCEFDNKAEVISEYNGFDSSDDIQLVNHLLKSIKECDDSNKTSCSTLLSGFYYSIATKDWKQAEPYIIKSYWMGDAIPETQAVSAYLLYCAYQAAPILKTTEGIKIIDHFSTTQGISMEDVGKIFDDCLYAVFIEQIKSIE